MTFFELNDDQRLELKQNILSQRYDARGETPSYGELAWADELVSDEDLEEWYGDTVFSEDDFLCSAGK
jgi:hypothetical protein